MAEKFEIKITHEPTKLLKLKDEAHGHLKETMLNAANFIHQHLPGPPAPPTAPYPFVSERQHRFVFWLMQNFGRYRRSNGLVRSITTDVKDLGTTVVGTIGTNKVYAPWVISDEPVGKRGPQAAYHKGRWWTLQQVIRDKTSATIDFIKKDLGRWAKF